MKIEIENIKDNPLNLMRRAGYIFQRNKKQEMIFVRPLARAGYPRFHAYTKIVKGKLVIRIHLDQKKNTYGENIRHHGEYENDGALAREAERIKKTII